MKEECATITLILEKIRFYEHQWVICEDLRWLPFSLDSEVATPNIPVLDIKDRTNHWAREEWPNRENTAIGEKNVINHPLIGREKIIFPPLHVK